MYKIQESQRNRLDSIFGYAALTVLSAGALIGFRQYINGNGYVQAGGALLLVLLLVKTAIKR